MCCNIFHEACYSLNLQFFFEILKIYNFFTLIFCVEMLKRVAILFLVSQLYKCVIIAINIYALQYYFFIKLLKKRRRSYFF